MAFSPPFLRVVAHAVSEAGSQPGLPPGALEILVMWMPSDQPLLDANVEELVLDWETIGRAIRECVLDAIEMKAAQSCVPSDETAVNGRANRRIGLD